MPFNIPNHKQLPTIVTPFLLLLAWKSVNQTYSFIWMMKDATAMRVSWTKMAIPNSEEVILLLDCSILSKSGFTSHFGMHSMSFTTVSTNHNATINRHFWYKAMFFILPITLNYLHLPLHSN